MTELETASRQNRHLLMKIAVLGRDFADMKMRTDGFVTPSLVGICPEGFLVFSPERIMSSDDRAFFDLSAKLICSAYKVMGAAIVIEALVNAEKPAQGGMSVPKKKVQEVGVIIISETGNNSARTMFNVARDSQGQYLGFVESNSQDFQITSGRYRNFVPRKDFGETFCQEARTTIRNMKLDIQLHSDDLFLK